MREREGYDGVLSLCCHGGTCMAFLSPATLTSPSRSSFTTPSPPLPPPTHTHVGGAAGTRTVGWAGLLLVRTCALLVLHARIVELEWQLLKTVLR